MVDPEERKLNVRWAVVILLLLAGIDGLLTRLLEGLWDSLRQRNSPAYLPLEWWMSVPFTVFVFMVLSALLTSFSSWKRWLRAFLSLCGFKVVFAGVTAFVLYYRTDIGAGEAFSQAMFLSLPSVLVHILFAALALMFLMDAFARRGAEEKLPSIYLPGAELEEPLVPPEAPAPAADISPAREAASGVALALPVRKLLGLFPRGELAIPPQQIEELSPSVPIPTDLVLSQLGEGRVEIEALTVVSAMPREAFTHSPEEVARQFPNGMMELPLREVVTVLPPGTLEPPQQEMQPEVDDEFPDPFHELAPPTPEEVPEKPAAAVEEAVIEEPSPAEEVSETIAGVPERALVLTEEEEHLLESAADVVQLSLASATAEFPQGAIDFGDDSAQLSPIHEGEHDHIHRLPETVVIPLELIERQLSLGEVRIQAKFILAQIPKECLSISEEEIIRSVPNGEVELPLREVVQLLPPRVLAPPDQARQPEVEDMPDPFREVEHPQPVGAEAAPSSREEELAAAAVSSRAEPSLAPEAAQQAAAPSEAKAALAPKEEAPPISYTEILREANLLVLPVDVVVALLPEGAFRVSAGQLKADLGADTVKVPTKMVMPQLKEGRVVIPVELFTVQFSPEHLGMSPEQIKARLAEGVVELPLQEIIWQVFTEIAQLPADQKLQPECEEISTVFHEIPHPARAPEKEETAAEQPEEDTEVAASSLREAEETADVQADTASGVAVEETAPEGVISPTKGEPSQEADTILRNLVQKCRGLGISEHGFLAAEDSFLFVLTPPTLSRESVGCGLTEVMGQMRMFCEEYRIGEPRKLIILSSGGALVCGELIHRDSAGRVVLASRNPSGAGVLSLLLDRSEAELRDLSALLGAELKSRAESCPSANARELRKTTPTPDAVPEEARRNILTTLEDFGMENCLAAEMNSGQKLVTVRGGRLGDAGGDSLAGVPLKTNALPPEGGTRPRGEGVFDIQMISHYCSEAGLGMFESLLLVTPQAKATLCRSTTEGEAYLLCLFAGTYGEGLVRAKAHKAARFLKL